MGARREVFHHEKAQHQELERLILILGDYSGKTLYSLFFRMSDKKKAEFLKLQSQDYQGVEQYVQLDLFD